MAMLRSVLAILLGALVGCVQGCPPPDDPSSSSSTSGGSGSGGLTRCAAPPAEDFNPLTGFTRPAVIPTAAVTSAADSGPGTLRERVSTASAGAVIAFDAGLAGATITLASTIELRGSITLDGSAAPGLTIDGANAVRLFHFNGDAPATIAFFGLRMIRGRTDGSGGAISLNGRAITFEVGGCTFEENAGSEGGAIRVGYAKGTNVSIHDSVFRANNGAIPGSRNGFSGGAISATGGSVHVTRCRFDGNQGPTTGALYTIHSDPVVEDTVFINNQTTRDNGGSGAFFADGGGPGDYNTNYDDPSKRIPGQITLRRVRFVNNRGAGDDGGAVEAYAYPMDVVTLESCVFKQNRSQPGRAGAVFIHADKEVHIVGTAFVDNHATSPGGAIWADGSAHYRIENSLFSGNVTDGDLGGALRLNIGNEARLDISSSTFVDNVASRGNGALWLPGQRSAYVKNSIFSNNTGPGWAQQINFPVTDQGGNILWPNTTNPTLANATAVDPALQPLQVLDGFELREPGSGSPAVDGALTPAPSRDMRGALRDARPDIGAVELGGTCDG